MSARNASDEGLADGAGILREVKPGALTQSKLDLLKELVADDADSNPPSTALESHQHHHELPSPPTQDPGRMHEQIQDELVQALLGIDSTSICTCFSSTSPILSIPELHTQMQLINEKRHGRSRRLCIHSAVLRKDRLIRTHTTRLRDEGDYTQWIPLFPSSRDYDY